MNNDILRLAASAFKSALQRQDRQAILAAARQLIALEAPLGDQWLGLSQQVFKWGELNLALTALNCWHRQGTPANVVNYEKAMILSLAGQTARAQKLVEALPAGFPTEVANAYLRGALAFNLGQLRDAEKEFRRALKARPDSGRSWQGLAHFGTISDADYSAMRALANAPRFDDPEDHAAVENALGLVEHRRGNRADAFSHFEKSTNIVRQGRAYSAEENEQSAQIAGRWTAEEISCLAECPAAEARKPIFVTGLPRSGTTLVEQILAAHSAVDGGGELGLAMQLEAISDGFAPADLKRYVEAGGKLRDLRESYLRLVAERIPGEGAFIDKTLNQSRSLGPYALIFPDAPVLWLRRDPLDNAWSIFRTWMSRSAIAGWSLADIAHHMKLEDRLFAHWKSVLGSRMLIVPYAELVTHPEEWIARMTAHCGLEVEAQQHRFHETSQRVTTASSLQVREPINRRGIGSAEPYREFMRPFIEAYEA
ncbi:hypothetical protein GRI89_12850 [Altererythrobacter salegens]|uniref:Uncharacterized protein n=1 Tax=Croceibacterium salegens TaxID=1737568 RepID=A0A6I4SZW3_9SPHN|nr:sulfotransferase [Croceibacterium salegens]MXO60426.1 hypothetical protein [Croceibacterium salegens]